MMSGSVSSFSYPCNTIVLIAALALASITATTGSTWSGSTNGQPREPLPATGPAAVPNLFWLGARHVSELVCERLAMSQASARCSQAVLQLLRNTTQVSRNEARFGELNWKVGPEGVTLEALHNFLSRAVAGKGWEVLYQGAISVYVGLSAGFEEAHLRVLAGLLQRHLPWAHCLGHLVSSLRATVPSQDPYTHVIIDEILPWFMYEAVVHEIPPWNDPKFEHAVGYPGQTPEQVRVKSLKVAFVDSVESTLDAGMASHGLALSVLFDYIHSAVVFTALAELLQVDRTRITRASYTSARVYRDLPGYKIPPHPDKKWKLVSFFLSLPDDAGLSTSNIATKICRPILDDGLNQEWWEHFDCRDSGYLPNRFMAFRVEHMKSYHAVLVDQQLLPANQPLEDVRLMLRGHLVLDRELSSVQSETPYASHFWQGWQGS